MRKSAVMVALAALWLAMLLLGAGELDRAILAALSAGDYPWIALAAIGFTKLGNWSTVVVVTILAAAWLAYKRKVRAALLLLIVSFTGRLLVILQKEQFARLRPEENLYLVEVNYKSFPSGHSANAIMVYLTMALLMTTNSLHRRWAVGLAALLALLIGVSRVLVGVHWPSDVVGGWAFGLFWMMLVLSVAEVLNRRRTTAGVA